MALTDTGCVAQTETGCVALTQTLTTRLHNRGRHLVVATEFCTLAPNICGQFNGTYFMSPSGA